MPNITIVVPDGTTNHGNSGLLCLPPQWTDYIFFFLGNYLAHAATILSSPGESARQKIENIVLAMAFPIYGMRRALGIFTLRPIFTRDPLQRAARANALCMVLKKNVVESQGDDVETGFKTATKSQLVSQTSHLRFSCLTLSA